jgi:two-component system, NarL family, vancomycin resistance sensor histidine kinase VraS
MALFFIFSIVLVILAFIVWHSYRQDSQDAISNLMKAMEESKVRLIKKNEQFDAEYIFWRQHVEALEKEIQLLKEKYNSRAIVQNPEDFVRLSEEENVFAIDEIIYFERTRISRELHDDLVQKLAAARLTLEHANLYPMRSEVSADISKAMQTLELAVSGIRYYISNELQPDFNRLKLAEVIQRLCNSMDRIIGRKLCIEIKNPEREFPIAPEVLRELFRITQQAIQNSITHSMGKNIFIIICWGEELFIEIKDDGVSFIRRQKNTGSQTMNSRAKRIGAKLDFVINSKGLVVELRLPRPLK